MWGGCSASVRYLGTCEIVGEKGGYKTKQLTITKEKCIQFMEETWAGCIRSDQFQLIKQNEKKGKEKNIFQRYLDECQFNVIISY